MALMLDASAAKSIDSLPESTAHDLWLTLGCSELGKCSFTMTPLVKYRRHGGNENWIPCRCFFKKMIGIRQELKNRG